MNSMIFDEQVKVERTKCPVHTLGLVSMSYELDHLLFCQEDHIEYYIQIMDRDIAEEYYFREGDDGIWRPS